MSGWLLDCEEVWCGVKCTEYLCVEERLCVESVGKVNVWVR